MKNLLKIAIIMIISFLQFNCSKDEDEKKCVKCILDNEYNDYQEFDLCELENGNAALNGNDTGYDYDLVVKEFRNDGVYECN